MQGGANPRNPQKRDTAGTSPQRFLLVKAYQRLSLISLPKYFWLLLPVSLNSS